MTLTRISLVAPICEVECSPQALCDGCTNSEVLNHKDLFSLRFGDALQPVTDLRLHGPRRHYHGPSRPGAGVSKGSTAGDETRAVPVRWLLAPWSSD